MSSNQITQARSMNGIIDFDGVENLNVDTIDAKNIDVENLEIETNLKVNNIDISPQELSFLNNTTSNIQTQLNNITTTTNNAVTLTGTQVISGDKTLSGTTTLTGDLNVNSTNISPTELSALDGIQSNIQEQLNNAGISNAMTLNTQQVASGQKSFTQPVGLPSVKYENTSGTITGFMSSPTTLTYGDVSGVFSVQDSIIIGTGVDSTIISDTPRTGTPTGAFTSGDIVIASSGTPSTPIQQSVSAYFKGGQPIYISVPFLGFRNWFVFESLNNITERVNNDFTTALRWNTTSSVTIPNYIDDFVYFTNYTNTDINSVIFESNSNANGNVTPLLPNITARQGYIYDANTFIQKPYVETGSVSLIPVGDFLEGTGVIAPTKITARNNFSYTISSPNTITPSSPRTNFIGYIEDTEIIYYSNSLIEPLLNYESFVKGLCSPESMILTAGDFTKAIAIRFNSVVSTPNYTKTGYIQNASNIVFDNGDNLQVDQFVRGSGITKGKHYITSISNGIATLGDSTYPLTTSTSATINGYLFTNNVLVGTGFTLNDFVTYPTDIPDLRTIVSNINPTFVNLSTSNNIPTPNNKTYHGFSPSATEFYYNDTDSNVAINYYLKDNAISTPTTNHLITSVNTTNKKLTTANLPVATPTLSFNGYVNNTLNKIITQTAQSLNVDDGIDTTLINNSTRFVSSVSGIEIGVSGTLNQSPTFTDLEGYITGTNSLIAYDPNNRIILHDFIINNSGNTIGSINSTISSVTNLNNDFKQVNFSSSSGTATLYDTYESIKPNSTEIYINTPTLNLETKYSATYSSSLKYGRLETGIIGTTSGYTTNETSVSPINTLDNAINIILENGVRVVIFGSLKPQFLSGYFNKYFTYSGYVASPNFLKVSTFEPPTIQNAIQVSNPVITNAYLDFNFTDANFQNSNIVPNSDNFGYIYSKNGYYFFIQYGNSVYQYQDFLFERNITLPNSQKYRAKISDYTGMWIDNKTTGTAYNIGFTYAPTRIYSTNAEIGLITLSQTYSANVTQFNVYNSSPYLNPVGGVYVFTISGSVANYARITTISNNFNGTSAIHVDRSFPVGIANTTIILLNQMPNPNNLIPTFALRPANQLANFITPQNISVAQTQETFQSITPANVNIYSSSNFDSYNSYIKTTFNQITPVQFELFNGTSFEEIEQVNYNSFEKLDFSIYTLDTFLAQTSVNISFKPSLITNDTFVTTSEFTNGYLQPVLIAPTISGTTSSPFLNPQFTSSVILLNHPTSTTFFYNNQMSIRPSTGSTNMVLNSTTTQFIINNVNVLQIQGNHLNMPFSEGARIGNIGFGGYMGIQHNSLTANGFNYALLQDTAGNTFVNTSPSATLYFRRGNSSRAYVDWGFHIAVAGISYDGTTISNRGRNMIGWTWSPPYGFGSVDNVVEGIAFSASDRRIKKNIVDFTDGLNGIMKLKPRTYDILKVDTAKCDFTGDNCIIRDVSGNEIHYDCNGDCCDETEITGEKCIGLILDEVKPIFPEVCVGGGDTSIGSINYQGLVPMLIQAVQDQQRQIENLQEQINCLINI
jgi:hypothetical protein